MWNNVLLVGIFMEFVNNESRLVKEMDLVQ